MKPFNLEKALAGEPVITRDGRRVKIAGYNEEIYPLNISLLGWIRSDIGWCEYAWYCNGRYNSGEDNPSDLFMAPTERKEWVVRLPEYRMIGPFHNEKLAKGWQEQMNRPDSTIHEITITE
jgi:hypothetical protein